MTTITENATAALTETEKRAAYTAGLRALADLLDANPDLPLGQLPGQSKWSPFQFCAGLVSHDDTEDSIRTHMVEWSRLLMVGERTKDDGRTLGGTDVLSLNGRTAHGLAVQVYGQRDVVCTRRVVGTETVDEPDPNAPTVKVEREIVEWDCAPLLADRSEPAS